MKLIRILLLLLLAAASASVAQENAQPELSVTINVDEEGRFRQSDAFAPEEATMVTPTPAPSPKPRQAADGKPRVIVTPGFVSAMVGGAAGLALLILLLFGRARFYNAFGQTLTIPETQARVRFGAARSGGQGALVHFGKD